MNHMRARLKTHSVELFRHMARTARVCDRDGVACCTSAQAAMGAGFVLADTAPSHFATQDKCTLSEETTTLHNF